ncbi:hypothetical protein DFJ77DRAFT_436494 [Powellomyces hirtus]|nr:hypothetical protein DFJ77DRAFT_436494 [Powellomyces hirtus]
MSFRLRRAEARDSPAILRLIHSTPGDEGEKTLHKRFGNHVDIADIIFARNLLANIRSDGSPFSLVATDASNSEEENIVGFFALGNSPPDYIDDEGALAGGSGSAGATGRLADWTTWMQRSYDIGDDLKVYNTKFLRFLVVHPTHATGFLQEVLACALTQLPHIRNVAYFLPKSTILFAPLNTNRADTGAAPASNTPQSASTTHSKVRRYFADVPMVSPDQPFRLLVCRRKHVLPIMRVRPARVEDADDLAPMFREQNLIGESQKPDFYLAALLEDQSDNMKTLVAEANGEVIGFMSINKEIQQAALIETFHLDAFDNLVKEPRKKEKRVVVDVRDPTPPPPPTPPVNPDEERLDVNDESPEHGRLSIASAGPSTRPSSGGSAALSGESVPSIHEQAPDVDISATPATSPPRLFSIAPAYATQAHELVKAAFATFEERDFCVVTTDAAVPESPLVKSFVAVPARRGMSDKFSVLDTPAVAVARAVEEDLEAVDCFVDELQGQDDLRAAFKAATQNQLGTVPRCFTVRTIPPPPGAGGEVIPGQVVGVVVTRGINNPVERKQWTDQFDIAQYTSSAFALVLAVLINPLFANHSRWVLEEVMRQTGVHALIHAVPHDLESDGPVLATDAATRAVAQREFVPIRPRREIVFPNNMRDGQEVPGPLPCSLRILTAPLLYERKTVVNTRIVVVGASDCGLGFLEKLAYNPRLTFTNLTLISTDGLASTYRETGPLMQLGLQDHVRIVRGTVEEVDRMAKRCQLEDGSVINYDYVLLTPGMQFNCTSMGVGAAGTHGVYPLNPGEEEAALGVACARGPTEAGLVMWGGTASVLIVFSNPYTHAACYGRDLQAFSGVNILLSKGIEGKRITLVVPPPRLPATCFDNNVIDRKVREVMRALGVTVLDGYVLDRIENEFGAVTGVVLHHRAQNKRKSIRPVCAVIYADDRSVAPGTFRVINDSCLVFDGRLVVDKFFCTPDPSVFAAGTVTKYSSRYQTTWEHGLSDSREVGAKFASMFLSRFDPTSPDSPSTNEEKEEDTNTDPRENGNPPPLRFKDAKKTVAVLPGDLQYFHFDRPRLLSHTLEFRAAQPDYGRDLVLDSLEATSEEGSGGARGSYFRIHVAPMGHIESITYLGRRRIPLGNILCLYGMHEKYVNNVVARFDEGIIEDFVTFFAQDWALPLYFDRFGEFTKDIDEELHALRDKEEPEPTDADGNGGGGTIAEVLDTLAEQLDTGVQMSEEEQRSVYKAFDCATGRKVLDGKVFEYLLECEVYRSFP